VRSFVLILLLVLSLSSAAHAGAINPIDATDFADMVKPAQNTGDTAVYADFFYGAACPHCLRVKPLVEKLAAECPQVHLQCREVYFNATNREMFRDCTDRYGVESETIPLLIIGNTAMVGEEEIRAGLEPFIAHESGERLSQSEIWQSFMRFTGNAPEPGGTDRRNTTAPADKTPSRETEITLASVLVAAAADSINPCAFAVLVVLLAYLTSVDDRKRLLQVGVAYIATVFVVYLLSGLGFFAVVQAYGISGTVFALAGLIAVAAGLIQIGEALLKHDGFSLSIPESMKAGIGRYVRRASVPSAIALAVLVSVVELPCTGGIYLAILGLLGSRMTFAGGLPYLVLYNLIFVLPLAIILLIVYHGVSPGRVDAWRVGTKRGIRFAIGCVMVGLGGAMLLGIL
jgi:cytochrome c biogenesis protein CcdA/glutaredoxin